nr:uncharacterized protein LOC104092019 [Nicotiana tomentosiformis]
MVETFQNGVSRDGSRVTRKLLSRLLKYSPTTWDEFNNAYCAEVRADEDDLNGATHRITSVQAESRKDRRDNARRDHPIPRPNGEHNQLYIRMAIVPSLIYEEGPSRPRTGTYWNDRGMPPLLSAHNFYVSPTEIVYALQTFKPKVKWPPKIRSVPNTRKFDALFGFYQERGHKTEDYITLRQEVLNILRQGHLKGLLSDMGRTNFSRRRKHQGPPKPPSPARTINMTIGGNDDTSINSVKFTTTHKLKQSITCERYDELKESIMFDKSDADSLTFPHNDALAITLRILDTDVQRIMIDDGSSTCIIHPRMFTQMRFEDKIVPHCITLIYFNNAVE